MSAAEISGVSGSAKSPQKRLFVARPQITYFDAAQTLSKTQAVVEGFGSLVIAAIRRVIEIR